MTTRREARIATVRKTILNTDPWVSYGTLDSLCENVVDALFGAEQPCTCPCIHCSNKAHWMCQTCQR